VRARASILPAIAALCVAGCSTHDAKFDTVATTPVTPAPVVDPYALQLASASLISRYAGETSSLPTESLALLARAAADGDIAVRDFSKPAGVALLQDARRLADALASRAIAVGGGQEYPVDVRHRSGDPGVSGMAGDALLDVFLATAAPKYAADVSAVVRALMSPAEAWQHSAATGGDGTATAATAALFLERAADVDVTSTSTGVAPSKPDHAQLVSQRALAAHALTAAARALSSVPSPDPAQLARTLIALTAPATAASNPDVTTVADLSLGAVQAMFLATGAPAAVSAANGPGFSSCLALAALPAGSPLIEHALKWALTNRRADGSLPFAADSDPVGQAFCLVTMEREVFLLQRGVLPQP
jgi:hypothetical protein